MLKKLLIICVALTALLTGAWVKSLSYNEATDFKILGGQELSWKNLEGNWVVVNYFAQWCAPCLREIPELNQFYQAKHPNIMLFAVSFDPLQDQALSELIAKHNMQFPVISELRSTPWQQKPVGLPTTYIIAPDGRLATQIQGEITADTLLDTINSL